MKIGELAERIGVSVRMIRYYEEQGLLQPKRTAAGYRYFEQKEIRTVERIKLLSSAGMNLATILKFLPCVKGEGLVFEPCDELRVLLREQIQTVDDESVKLAKKRATLSKFLHEIEMH